MKMYEKIQNIYEKTMYDGLFYDGLFDDINFYKLFIQATANDFLFKIDNKVNAYSFRCKNCDKNAVLIIFSMPINDERNYRSKEVSEKIMSIVENLEQAFITIDKVNCIEVKNDKFIYLIAIKNLEVKDEENKIQIFKEESVG